MSKVVLKFILHEDGHATLQTPSQLMESREAPEIISALLEKLGQHWPGATHDALHNTSMLATAEDQAKLLAGYLDSQGKGTAGRMGKEKFARETTRLRANNPQPKPVDKRQLEIALTKYGTDPGFKQLVDEWRQVYRELYEGIKE